MRALKELEDSIEFSAYAVAKGKMTVNDLLYNPEEVVHMIPYIQYKRDGIDKFGITGYDHWFAPVAYYDYDYASRRGSILAAEITLIRDLFYLWKHGENKQGEEHYEVI